MSSPGLVEETIGGAPYDVTVAGYDVPPDALGPLSITRGRRRSDQRPEPASCSFVIATERVEQLPIVGDTVTIDLSPAALAYLGLLAGDPAVPRFRGRVSDLLAVSTGKVTGPARVQVIAVGPRARAVRTPVGVASYPAELDGARAVRIVTEAIAVDPSLVAGLSDPGTWTVQARTGEETDAGTLLDRLAVSSGGELVETRAGELEWHDADHRRNLAPVLTLTPDNVLAESAEAAQGLAGVLNVATLQYGTVGASVLVEDAESSDPITGIGPVAQSLETDLPDSSSATARGEELVGRYGTPRWRLERLAVELCRTVDAGLAADLLGLEFGQLLRVEGFPTTGPFPAARLFLEGGTEQATRDAWRYALAVSDYALTGSAPRWSDLGNQTTLRYRSRFFGRREFLFPVAVAGTGPTWADLATNEPELTWLGAYGWDVDSATADRWADQPADRSWVETDPTTWAAYTGA